MNDVTRRDLRDHAAKAVEVQQVGHVARSVGQLVAADRAMHRVTRRGQRLLEVVSREAIQPGDQYAR